MDGGIEGKRKRRGLTETEKAMGAVKVVRMTVKEGVKKAGYLGMKPNKPRTSEYSGSTTLERARFEKPDQEK